MAKFSTNTKARAWFVTVQIQNFINAGLNEEQYKDVEFLADFLTDTWVSSGKSNDRTCAVSICVSADGLYHAHMSLYGNVTTLNNVAKIMFSSHVEPVLAGKKELKEYMLKEGKYADKNETILYSCGIENIMDNQGNRSDLEVIEEMLLQGNTPQQILDTNFRYYRFKNMILSAYARMRIKNAPIMKDLHVEWHTGHSGTGKTYFYKQLCDKFSPDDIYLMNDFQNGGLDGYMLAGAPKIIFIDEYKGELPYSIFLTMLTPYSRMQTHARYSNAYNLWEKVYITSIYAPEEAYNIMVNVDVQSTDNLHQLLRRIDKVVYHYKIEEEYKTVSIDGKNYKNKYDLKKLVEQKETGFTLEKVNDEKDKDNKAFHELLYKK